MIGPRSPVPMVRPSTEATGARPAKVPVTNDSSAPYTSDRLNLRSSASMPSSPQRRSTLARVMPWRQWSPVEVHTAPRRTMKKWVELQVATNPSGSSMRASSAPALAAWMQAVMQFSLEWVLSFGSWTSGRPRRTCTVNSDIPAVAVDGRGALYSGIVTIVGGEMVNRGSW